MRDFVSRFKAVRAAKSARSLPTMYLQACLLASKESPAVARRALERNWPISRFEAEQVLLLHEGHARH